MRFVAPPRRKLHQIPTHGSVERDTTTAAAARAGEHRDAGGGGGNETGGAPGAGLGATRLRRVQDTAGRDATAGGFFSV